MLEQLQLEAVFAWLSTLGGAHSALGDYFNENVIIDVVIELIKTLFILDSFICSELFSGSP
jgi:hypothetical protein